MCSSRVPVYPIIFYIITYILFFVNPSCFYRTVACIQAPEHQRVFRSRQRGKLKCPLPAFVASCRLHNCDLPDWRGGRAYWMRRHLNDFAHSFPFEGRLGRVLMFVLKSLSPSPSLPHIGRETLRR